MSTKLLSNSITMKKLNMLTKAYVNTIAFLESLKKDERGVTAIEYAIVAVAIAALVSLVFTGDGNTLQAALQTAIDRISAILVEVGGGASGKPPAL